MRKKSCHCHVFVNFNHFRYNYHKISINNLFVIFRILFLETVIYRANADDCLGEWSTQIFALMSGWIFMQKYYINICFISLWIFICLWIYLAMWIFDGVAWSQNCSTYMLQLTRWMNSVHEFVDLWLRSVRWTCRERAVNPSPACSWQKFVHQSKTATLSIGTRTFFG